MGGDGGGGDNPWVCKRFANSRLGCRGYAVAGGWGTFSSVAFVFFPSLASSTLREKTLLTPVRYRSCVCVLSLFVA